MNLLALKGEIFCRHYIIYEVRSARKFINCGACVADPTANKVLLKKKFTKSTTWPQKGRTKTCRLEDSTGVE
jgi:hypothetical protein